MGNELEKIIANQLPEAGKISQHANKLYNINHVEHITITPYPTVPTLDKGIATPTDGLMYDYYNLVVGSSVIDSVFVKVDKKRAIEAFYGKGVSLEWE